MNQYEITDDILRGSTVRLSAISEDDAATMIEWYEDPATRRMFGSPAVPRSEAQLREWIAGWQKSPDGIDFGIRLIDSDQLIGKANLSGYRTEHHRASLGLEIARAYQGKGYGYEAMGLVLAFAFRELNLHRLSLSVASYNQAAIGLYEKLGFKKEGVAREAMQKDGAYHDVFSYGLLQPEWAADA